MKVVGLLSWYDESESWLATAVAGFAEVCDAIVACDGAYSLFPGARARSHPAQAEAVMAACEAADVECVIHRPSSIYFGNEVEKRNQTLRLAAALNPDWVVVFDGDYAPMQIHGDAVRRDLEQTEMNVVTYTLMDSKDMLANPDVAATARDIALSTEWTTRVRDIFRWTPDLEYVGAHYFVRGTYNRERQWLKGQSLSIELADCDDLNSSLVVYHRTAARALVRREASQGYYRVRDSLDIENVDHLKDPVAA